MHVNPRFSTKNYRRRGFRLRGNTLVLLFIFFLIGLFLHYGGQTKPVVAFWNDFREMIGLGRAKRDTEANNPYKAPEPRPSDESTDKQGSRQTDESEASDNGGNNPSAGSPKTVRFDFEKQVDFLLPLVKPGDEIIRHEGFTLR